MTQVSQLEVNVSNEDGIVDDEEDPLEAELSRDPEDYVAVANDPPTDDDGIPTLEGRGSTVAQATFNFTNCIVGAGAIGLGGAIAESGGIISIVSVILFAFLVKLSLDLVIETSLRHGCSSFEELGDTAFGSIGRNVVMIAKFAYSFGCLVAYTVVVKDNLGPALSNLIPSLCSSLTDIPGIVTWAASTGIILPLCMLKDMTPLSGASIFSIGCMISIILIVAGLWVVGQQSPDDDASNDKRSPAEVIYRHWVLVHAANYLDNVGTFLFAFVCHHTVHLVFRSLKPEIRTLQNWKKVSALSLSTSCLISLSVGVLVYMTFWEKTESDIFEIYPPSMLIDLAKLLLCATMLLTFPLPFFTCRELIEAVMFPYPSETFEDATPIITATNQSTLIEPLLRNEENVNPEVEEAIGYVSLAEASGLPLHQSQLSMIQDDHSLDEPIVSCNFSMGRHVGLTVSIWLIATALGVGAPNLGDVLDLVGCLSGTLIAFILPAASDWKLSGYSHLNLLILSIGLVVGSLGTICSLKKFIQDIL